ncbi:MAG: hypothetical protein AAF224_02645 [Pseudomonadota bacterium]
MFRSASRSQSARSIVSTGVVRISALAVGFLALAACATSTPYAPATDGNRYGFSEQRIESNRYRIMFRGNSSTTRETVETFLLYRAAELTLMNGFDHFIVIENDTEARSNYSTTTTGPAFFGRYGYGFGPYAFPYYAYGWGWGGGFGPGWGGAPFDSYTREITRYSAVAFVTMHQGEKPADNPQAFDARDVADNLRDAVLGTPES